MAGIQQNKKRSEREQSSQVWKMKYSHVFCFSSDSGFSTFAPFAEYTQNTLCFYRREKEVQVSAKKRVPHSSLDADHDDGCV